VDGINAAGIIVLMWRLSLQVLSDAAVSLELPLVFQIAEELTFMMSPCAPRQAVRRTKPLLTSLRIVLQHPERIATFECSGPWVDLA